MTLSVTTCVLAISRVSHCVAVHWWMRTRVHCLLYLRFTAARRYSSAAYDRPVASCLSVSDTSRCAVETAERMDQLFSTETSFNVSYTMLCGNSSIVRYKGTWNSVPYSGRRKISHGSSTVTTTVEGERVATRTSQITLGRTCL